MSQDDDFAAFVSARGAALRRSAFLMTGNWHDAEDLVQTALAKLYVAWPRVRVDGAEAYTRTIVARTHVDSRRRFWHREQPSDVLPDHEDAPPDIDDEIDLARVLASLPADQRAVLVLRYWDDLSVEQTAQALRISHGTVKSRTSRALDSMRLILGTELEGRAEEAG